LLIATQQFSGGMGVVYPENLAEYCVYFLATVFGTTLLAVFVGTICSLTSNSDPNEAAYHHQLDSLNYFLTDLSIEGSVRVRAREYLSNARHLLKKNAYNKLVDSLSPQIRADIVKSMSAQLLHHVWFLQGCEQALMIELSLKLNRVAFGAGETVQMDKFSILTRGLIARKGIILSSGEDFGEDMLLLDATKLRDKRRVRTITYVELTQLSRDDFDECVGRFPDSSRVVQRHALQLAMRRALPLVGGYSNMLRARRIRSRLRGALIEAANQDKVTKFQALARDSSGERLDFHQAFGRSQHKAARATAALQNTKVYHLLSEVTQKETKEVQNLISRRRTFSEITWNAAGERKVTPGEKKRSTGSVVSDSRRASDVTGGVEPSALAGLVAAAATNAPGLTTRGSFVAPPGRRDSILSSCSQSSQPAGGARPRGPRCSFIGLPGDGPSTPRREDSFTSDSSSTLNEVLKQLALLRDDVASLREEVRSGARRLAAEPEEDFRLDE